MADAREVAVWTNHAVEQWEQDKAGRDFSDEDFWRRTLASLEGVEKVLDLGCGGALWRKLFRGYDYTGTDQNPNMIRYARKRFPEDKFVLANAMSLPFEDEEFDLVFTSAVLQHNRHEDKKKVVQQIVRVLRPGGYYLCTENTFRKDNYRSTFKDIPKWNPALDDGYSFTSDGWMIFMYNYGLEMVWYKAPSEYLFKKAGSL